MAVLVAAIVTVALMIARFLMSVTNPDLASNTSNSTELIAVAA